jgi:hypothetical protein
MKRLTQKKKKEIFMMNQGEQFGNLRKTFIKKKILIKK